MSQQGLCGLTNPFITSENSFRGRFCEGTDLVFGDCLSQKGLSGQTNPFGTCARSFGSYF